MSPSPEGAVHDLRVILADRRDDFDGDKFDRIYAIAEKSHRGQQRRSGDPFILHPVVVATYVAAWGLPLPCVYAALLHDVTDTDLTDFSHDVGRDVMELVAGVASVSSPADVSAMLGGTDVSTKRFNEYVLTIKIADRVHNAQTWQPTQRANARRKATETMNTLAPLAKELGLPAVGAELRSLSFALLAGQEAVAQLGAPTPPLAFVAGESTPRSPLTDALCRRALRLVPIADRERYAAEWLADLASLPSGRARATLALGLLYSARALRRDSLVRRSRDTTGLR